MRIIAGTHKGRRLTAPKGDVARPTTDRVRESLFNLLVHGCGVDLEDARVIDAFAGSGALGFEAISRGAAFALFIETHAACRGAIRDNIEAMGLFGTTRIHRRSATDLGRKPPALDRPFDLAFLDPPYRENLIEPAVASLIAGDWLTPTATLALETAADEPTPCLDGFEVLTDRTYGDTRLTIAARAPSPD